VTVEDPPRLSQALDWMIRRMDFADALHLAKAGECAAFLSFDRKLAKLVLESGGVPVEEP
jgi:predicted nucleic-acid-binding protein